MIPVVGCMMTFWLWIAIKNLKLSRNINKRRFIPVLTFIVLYGATVIVQGLLGRWILLSTLAHTIIVVIMINTIENPETKMLGAVTTAKDKMERLSVAKDEFMSIASHQLRTPITAIEGYSDMLARGDFGKLTKEQERAIRQINESATNMSSSVKDFLNISRIQTGHFVLNKTECSVREIVEKRIAQTRAMASEKNVKIIAQYGKKLPEAVMIDEEKISQVVMNFIDNAIYYTYPKHKVVIDLVVHSKQLVFTVEDEGIGVPAKEQSKLFSKFYRASNARTTRPDGTGIGLFLAKKIITTHGGTIIFSSIEGKGSVFGFSLPLDKLK
jgi:signal transduction histidine kinase